MANNYYLYVLFDLLLDVPLQDLANFRSILASGIDWRSVLVKQKTPGQRGNQGIIRQIRANVELLLCWESKFVANMVFSFRWPK